MAQQRGPADPSQMADKQTEMMTKELSLDDAQITIVDSINQTFAVKMKEALDANGGDRRASRSAIMELRDQQNEALKAVLTEEQFTTLEAIMKERKGRRGQGRRAGQ